MKNLLAAFFVMAYVSACGGGGDTTTPIGTPVNLSQIKSFTEATAAQGTVVAFKLTGSDTIGGSYTGTEILSVEPETTFEGQTVRVGKQDQSLIRSGVPSTETVTRYVLSTNNLLYKTVSSSGVVGIPVSQSLLPAIAKVGEFGDYMVLLRNDGYTETILWRLDAGVNGASIFVLTDTWSISGGNYLLAEEKYNLDTSGNVTSIAVRLFYTDSGLTVTLSGPKVTL